jgi:cell wall-associated NlpC family hydrolase
MKWLIAICVVIASAPNGAHSAQGAVLETTQITKQVTALQGLGVMGLPKIQHLTLMEQQLKDARTLMERQVALAEEQKTNAVNMDAVVAQLKTHIGKTPYVFSGDSPSGWDCSGLAYWAYQQLGVELWHSANAEGHSGKVVDTPKIGDIVVFAYKGSKSYYHASIYIGNNEVIHAGFRPGTRTSVISLSDPSFKDSTETFVQILDRGTY